MPVPLTPAQLAGARLDPNQSAGVLLEPAAPSE
jgi:hypothetical protein